MVSAAEMPISEAKESPHEAHPAAAIDTIPVPNMILKFPFRLSKENLFITMVMLIPKRTAITVRNTMSIGDVA